MGPPFEHGGELPLAHLEGNTGGASMGPPFEHGGEGLVPGVTCDVFESRASLAGLSFA